MYHDGVFSSFVCLQEERLDIEDGDDATNVIGYELSIWGA